MAGLFGATMSKRKPRKRLTIKAIKARHYSPAYEARLIRAARKGKTRQSARGHKPKEHIIRKIREKIALGGLTSAEIKIITKWHETKFNPNGYREVPDLEELIDWSREKGYDGFKLYRKTWDDTRRQYVKEQADGTYESRGMGYLYDRQNVAKADDYRWLYYH